MNSLLAEVLVEFRLDVVDKLQNLLNNLEFDKKKYKKSINFRKIKKVMRTESHHNKL